MELHDLIAEIDLPALVLAFAPESKAIPGKPGVYFASWRGNKDTPSFSIQKWNGVHLWKDQATQESGNAYSFATKIMGLSDQEARAHLETFTGKTLTARTKNYKSIHSPDFVPPKMCDDKVVDIGFNNTMFEKIGKDVAVKQLKARGFKKQDVANLLLTADGDDLIFPVFNHSGDITNWKRRIHESSQRYTYELSGHGSPAQCLKTDRPYIVIVEGELNSMIAHSVFEEHGEKRVGFMGVASANAHLNLKAIENKIVYIYADPDEPGTKAREAWRTAAIYAGATEVHDVQAWSSDEDFCDVATRSRDELFESLKNAIATAIKMYSPMDREIGGYTAGELLKINDEFLDDDRKGIGTGFIEIDNYTGGLPESGVVLVGALPSYGKSSFLRGILRNYLEKYPDNKIALFSPDQSVASILRMFASEDSGIPLTQIKARRFSRSIIEKYDGGEGVIKRWRDCYSDLVLTYTKRFIVSEEMRMENVMAMIEPMIDRGVGMIAGDYATQFKIKGLYGNEHDEEVALKWKEATRKWKLPALLAVQLAKSKFGKMMKRSGFPTSNDIEGTGAWFAASEAAFLIYNQDMYFKEFNIGEYDEAGKHYNSDDVGKSRIYVAKNKEGGRGDFRYLDWDAEFVAFRNQGQRRKL